MIQPELLDTLEPEAGRANLADLVRLNRWWGGRSTLRRILDRAVPEASFSLLDVGAASGDMGAYVRQWRPRARVTSLDAVAWHLGRAAQPKLAGDGFALPFLESAFDYVFCSLFLHHFSDAQVVTLLSEFGRVARRAVLVIDLERHPLPYFFVGWTRWIFGWDRVTCHDAAVSVEAAFRPAELVRLARAAGLPNPQARAYRPAFRVGMIAGAAPAL